MQPGGDVHAASTETGERVATGRYAHRRSKQTQVPSGGLLLSQPAGGGAAATAPQRLGWHGSSHAQSLSFAHEVAPEAPPLDGTDGFALGPGSEVGLAPRSGLAAALPGVAAPSAGVVAAAVDSGGVDGAGAGVGLLHATIVRLATIVTLGRTAVRFIARGVPPGHVTRNGLAAARSRRRSGTGSTSRPQSSVCVLREVFWARRMPSSSGMSLFMDLDLARRLERAEGATGASFVEVRQRIEPGVGAVWQDFDGTYAMFDGVESPMTQTFGLGIFAPVSTGGLSAIEQFFSQRDADTMHEVSPLAGIETFALLADRGYRPIELGTVLVQPLDRGVEHEAVPGLLARECEPFELDVWVETSVAGWSDTPEVAHLITSIARAASLNPLAVNFVTERDGVAIATGSLVIHGRVALLAGASTIPSARGLGAQGMLLAARLSAARRRGCDLAMMVASPGSTSQRNAERRGFRVAYTRTKWRLARRTG